MNKSERVRRRKGDGSSRTDDGVSEVRTANGTGCGKRWANTSNWGAEAKGCECENERDMGVWMNTHKGGTTGLYPSHARK